ncbi:hypothetical protein Tco_1268059 [Tanacetum coccineum]
MATTDKESSAAGTDNRPPMLEESDFESWKIRIERYIREAENNKDRADIQATNILSQGLPRYIFNTLKQTETAKEIWENVELLMQGFSLTEQQKKETLFDQYERSLKWKSQFIRNTKFVNNLPLYWGNYVIIVKNSKDISTVSYVDLYTLLKSYEQHALKTLSKMNQTSGNTNPLAYIAKATLLTSSPSQYVPPPPQYAPALQQAPQSTSSHQPMMRCWQQ